MRFKMKQSPLFILFLLLISQPVFAAGAVPEYLVEMVELVVISAIVAYICHRLGLVPIIGFLVAGVIIGPNTFGVIQDQALIDAMAEIGVILLLYTIGIEFSLEKLAKIKNLIFGGGGMQLLLTTGIITGIVYYFGIDWKIGIFTGFLVTLSSTVIVLKLLASRGETNTTVGRISLGLLIFQDLAIIVMVLLVPILAGGSGSVMDISFALGKAGVLIVVVLYVARKIMPKILEKVAQTCSTELFLLTIIAICFGTAYVTSLADVSVSLGAFLAGLIVSESRFSQHAFSEILPLQILFSATFFVSVGMMLDINFLMQNIAIVLACVAIVLVLKVITTAVSVMFLRYDFAIATASALTLAQVGEFSFVLEKAGREVGLTPLGMGEAGSQTFIAATVVLMVLTPVMTKFGMKLSGKMQEKKAKAASDKMEDETVLPDEIPHLENHVIVAGYGQAARKLTQILANSEIPFFIITLNPDGANEAESHGLIVLRGDPTKQRTLLLAGLERAKMLIIPDDNPQVTHHIAAVARTTNPTIQIVAKTRYISEIEHLQHAGVDRVIPEELESIVQLLKGILYDYHLPQNEIESNLETVRSGNYSAMRFNSNKETQTQQSVIDCHSINQDCMETRTFKIRQGAPVVGQTLSKLELNKEFGILITNIVRGKVQYNIPQASFVIEAGDEVELSGSAVSFQKAAFMFRGDVIDHQDDGWLNAKASVDLETEILHTPKVGNSCSHISQMTKVLPTTAGCEECLREGKEWVHLRVCMSCGHVGCCDSSEGKHATAHYLTTGHPIAKSLENNENWAWCYIDNKMV